MNGIEKITSIIIKQAEDEAEKTFADTRREADKILSEYNAKAEDIIRGSEERAVKETERTLEKARSGAVQATRKAVLDEKTRLLDELYDKVKAYYLSLDDIKYKAFLSGVLFGVLKEKIKEDENRKNTFGEESEDAPCIVCTSPRDAEICGSGFIEEFRSKYKNSLPDNVLSSLSLGSPDHRIDGGLILRCGSYDYNCSLSMIISAERAKTEAQVTEILFSN